MTEFHILQLVYYGIGSGERRTAFRFFSDLHLPFETHLKFAIIQMRHYGFASFSTRQSLSDEIFRFMAILGGIKTRARKRRWWRMREKVELRWYLC
jgi:hypothetical protein